MKEFKEYPINQEIRKDERFVSNVYIGAKETDIHEFAKMFDYDLDSLRFGKIAIDENGNVLLGMKPCFGKKVTNASK